MNEGKNTLPKDWKSVRLEEVCEKARVIKRKDQNPQSKLLYVDIGGVDNRINKIISHKEYRWKDAPSRAQQIIYKNSEFDLFQS